MVEVARGAATLEGATVGKGIELGMALGALQDNIAVALGHYKPTGVEGAGALVADELAIADPHNNKSVGAPYKILVAVAIVDARVKRRVGVYLAVGFSDRHLATNLFLTTT